jgi:hypothetical protein
MNDIELPFTMCITLGDYSHDGHSHSARHILRSNYSADDVGKAYRLAVEKSGIDFASRVASKFEDKTYPVVDFKELGCPEDLLTDDETDEYSYGLVVDEDHYIALFEWFCTLAQPDLILESGEAEVPDLVHTIRGSKRRFFQNMGYGLYSL